MPASTKGGSKQIEDGWEHSLVILEKTSAKQGFGIAISGGLDNPHFKTGDISIIVSDIVQGSPADGKLKVGDILLSVNERNVDGHSHLDAVEALKAAGMQARMEIKRPSANPPKTKKVENLNDSKLNGSKETDSERGRSRKKPKEMEQEISDRKKHHSSKEGEQDGEKPHRHRSKSREKGDEEGEKSSRSHSRSREDNAEGEKSERSHRSRSKNREDNADGEKPQRSRSSNREDNAEGEKSGKSHRSRSKNREDNEVEKTEKSHRSRSKNREDNAEGEKTEKSHRSRSKNREDNAEGEKTEKSHRSRSRNREDNAEGEKTEKSHRSRSRNREDNVEGEKTESSRKSKTSTDAVDGEKNDKHRSRSKTREDGVEVEKPRSRSTQRKPLEDAEKLNSNKLKEENSDNLKVPSRNRSKSRSRDDLTRSKSKESLHRSKSKDALNAVETVTVILNRGEQGYGFSLGQQIFVKDLAKDSPAAKAKNLEKGDIVREINGTPLENLKISECIEIIRGATETLTLTIVKKPKVEPQLPVEKPKSLEVGDEKVKSKELAAGEKPKPSSRTARPQEVSEAQVKAKAEKVVQKEPDQKLLGAKISQPDRHSSPVPSIDDHNDTKDSWADATPQKHYSSAAHPNQEVEDMNAKLDRLKANRKLERRMSQLPHAKVISFHKTGSVGIQVAGGNSVGIFVAAIRPDSAAAKEGLKPGDQIIMCNEIDFEDITREEAVLILLALPDDVSLVVESKQSTFDQIKKELGDNFFIRVNFDHAERANANELTFRKGEIFNVRDTMYQGLIGYWQAQRVGKNAQMLERGVLPNKSRAEQLAIAQKMEDRQALTPTKSKLKRKNSISGTLKKQKFVSQDRLDESSFTEGVQIPAYERVVLKVADFMRPVVVLGPLADLARIKLLEEMPDRFDVPSPSAFDHHGDNNSISLSEIRNVIAKNKHCLLDITPEGIEMLMYAQLCPIVVLLNSTSRSAVKEMRQSLVKELLTAPTSVNHFSGDPMNAKQLKNVFNNANKLNEFYPHIFTSKINTHVAGGDVLSRAFYEKLKEVIFTQQAQSAWMPEEKPDEMLDDMVFHQPNYISYTSGVDSDTEGESTTSSPVLARKHYDDDDDSPLASPIDEAPVFMPPEPEKKKSADKVREKSKDRKRDPSDDRDVKSERSKKDKVSKTKNEPVIEKSPPSASVDKQSESTNTVKSSQGKELLPNYNDYRDPPNGYRQPDYIESSKRDYRDSSRDDYRDPPPKRQLEEKIDEPSRILESNVNKEPDISIGHLDQEENIPVLRDPKYVLPKPIPDSPPSRSPPEVKIKPINSVKVLPTEIKTEFSMDEKRRSLKKVGDAEDHYDTPKRPTYKEPEVLPPYRPSPPAEEVPTKVLSLQERMSKFQQKVVSQPPKVVAPRDESPPPRPLAPRNYIIDTRNQSAPQQQLFAQNAYKPTTQFAEVKRVLPKSNPVVEPYATMNFAPSVESSNPNYDYVKPRSQLTTNLDYDLPHQEHEQQSRPLVRNDSETHYKQPLKYDGYSVPPSNYKKPSNDDYYPAYKPPQDITNYQDEDGDEEPKVIATARGWFDHRGGLLESSETNVSIYIPAGALPAGRQQEVYFKVCQDSKHMPPLDSSSGETLLSPLVMCGPHGLKFKKPIELRLPHKGATSDGMAFSLKSSDSSTVGGSGPGHWKNVKLGGRDLDSGRAYQVTDDTVSVLVDHF